jgi:hypothetical protein
MTRFLDRLFHQRLISKQSMDKMIALVPLAVTRSPEDRVGKPAYGLGLMGDPESPWGPVWGHIGGGPGYSPSAFFVPQLGDVPRPNRKWSDDRQHRSGCINARAIDSPLRRDGDRSADVRDCFHCLATVRSGRNPSTGLARHSRRSRARNQA